MSIDFSVLVWTMINFIVLMLLLDRLLFRPYLKFMRERQAKADAGARAGRLAREELAERERRRKLELDSRAKSERLKTEDALEKARRDKRAALLDAQKREETRRTEELDRIRGDESALDEELSHSLPRIADALADKLVKE